MTDRELMQQALDALEEINKLSIGENAICLPAEIDEAMDALRERLAQPEKLPMVEIEPVLTVQPEQEPVALETIYETIIQWDEGGGKRSRRELARRIVELYSALQPQMQPCAGRNCGSTNPNLHSAECFEDYEKSTGMSQWQRLTEEEINNSYLFWIVDQQDVIGFGRSIETKLKRKNT